MQTRTINDILQVLRNVKNSRPDFPLDLRSEILKVLDVQPDVAYESVSSPLFQNEIRRGVVKTVDSVYNYSSSVGVQAIQDDSTEEMGNVFRVNALQPEDQSQIRTWGYEEAAYFLGNWSRQTHAKNTEKKNSNDLVSTHDFNFEKLLTEEEYEKALENLSWGQIISELTSSSWQDSVKEYLGALREYETVKEIRSKMGSTLTDEENQFYDKKQKLYLEKRNNHIRFLKQRLMPANTDIEEMPEGSENLKILTSQGAVIAKAKVENYAQDATEDQEEIVLKYSSEKSSLSDVKGVISEL
jgi:hypothetical protein